MNSYGEVHCPKARECHTPIWHDHKIILLFFNDKYHKKLFNCIHNGTLLNLDKIMISFTRKNGRIQLLFR